MILKRKYIFISLYTYKLFLSSDLQLPGHAGEGESQPGQQDCDWSQPRGPSPQRAEGIIIIIIITHDSIPAEANETLASHSATYPLFLQVLNSIIKLFCSSARAAPIALLSGSTPESTPESG